MKWIYSLVRLGEVAYVGLTGNIAARRRFHSYSRKFRDCRFNIIRKVPYEDGLRIEAQIIRAYQRRGQASSNIQIIKAKTDDAHLVQMGVRIGKDLKAFVIKEASDRMVSKSDVVREALLEHQKWGTR